MRGRLEVLTSSGCNNNCLFCCDRTPELVVRPSHKAITRSEFFLEGRRTPRLSSIIFTGGEPSLHKELCWLLETARGMGYKAIALQTNGRLLKNKQFCLNLVKSGLNEVSISLHGSKPHIHNALTRSKNSYKETVQGLKNMIALKEKHNILINVVFTITRINVSNIKDYLDFIMNLKGVDSVILKTLIPTGNAKKFYDSLAVTYTQAAFEIKKAINSLKDCLCSGSVSVNVSPMPLCLMKGYETYVGTSKHDSRRKTRNDRIFMRKALTCKSKRCLGCSYRHRCEGIDKFYKKHFGDLELGPQKNI